MYGDDRPFYSPGSIDFGVDSHHSYSSDATEYSVNEMKYNHYYSGSQQSNISDEYHYNDIGRDYFKLPGFHQTFGSTEIGRFSQHDEIFEQIQNQVLSSSPVEPLPITNSPLSSLIEQHNSIQNESNQIQQNQNSRKTKSRSQRKTKSNKSIKTTNSKHAYPPSDNPTNYNIEPVTHIPYSNNMSEPCSKYWNNQSSYYGRPYLPTSQTTYPYNNHNCTNYPSPSSLHNQSCMCHNNYGSRYHHHHPHSSTPYNSYSPNYFYYENPYYSNQYHHNYHSNYWGYNCQTV